MDSQYFSVEDMVCRDGTPYPAEWETTRLPLLFELLDTIRDEWAGPIVIVDGYRTPEHNAALAKASALRNGGVSGVATSSQHIEGRAADIRPTHPTAERIQRLYDLIASMQAQGKIPALGGLGRYPGLWVHVDTRPQVGVPIARWGGTGAGQST